MIRFFNALLHNTLILTLTLSLLLGLSSTALAQIQSSEQNTVVTNLPNQLPEPIQHLKNKGLDIVREFHVGASITGWVVSYEGNDTIVYTTTDGEFLINGVLLDAQGNDLTEEHQKSWLPKPNWEDLATSYFITEKNRVENQADLPKSTIYMFFDANCPFCHLSWLALQPYRDAGLEVRWIPVAYLKPDSRDKAAALLSASPNQQAKRLEESMQTFGENPSDMGKAADDKDKMQLQANMSLMQAFGINGTPGWVWLNEAGDLQTHSGMLRLPRLPSVTGLPAQKHTEPTLMRFR